MRLQIGKFSELLHSTEAMIMMSQQVYFQIVDISVTFLSIALRISSNVESFTKINFRDISRRISSCVWSVSYFKILVTHTFTIQCRFWWDCSEFAYHGYIYIFMAQQMLNKLLPVSILLKASLDIIKINTFNIFRHILFC